MDNLSEKNDDYIDVESNAPYENDFLSVKQTPSLPSTPSLSTCSPSTMAAHRSVTYSSSPSFSHEPRVMKRSRSPSTADDEASKRVCLPSHPRASVKNDLRNIESLIERAPAKTSPSKESPTQPASMDPNYLYLFYMAQMQNHQKLPLLPPHLLNRHLFYNHQHQLQNFYHYPTK